MSGDPSQHSEYDNLAQDALTHVRAICKGNGIKTDAITIVSHKIALYTINAGTYLELQPSTHESHAQGKIVQGQQITSREAAMQQITQTMSGAVQNPVTRAQITDALLKRPDQGFGLARQTIPLDFLKRVLSWHEACQSCRGSGQGPCPKCAGRRVESCMKCSGRGLMPCPTCMATGLLQGTKCHRCQGQRYVPCDVCHRSGMMQCRTCNGMGIFKCGTCGGQGWKTHILTLSPQATTYFDYERDKAPMEVADVMENHGTEYLLAQKLKVRGRIADDKENVLGASYEVEFPFGEIVFALGKKQVKANLFGYQSDLPHFPYILDKMLLLTVEELEEAANDVGSVAAKIQKATRYRLMAQAFLTASKTTPKKTAAYLLKQYDIGLSVGMAEKIAKLAEETTSRITRKPRYYGLLAGLVLYGALASGFYLYGGRESIAAYLPNERFDFVFDVMAIILGCFITTTSIQMFGANAIRKALGHLSSKGQKSNLTPQTRTSGKWGYAGVFAITLTLLELAAQSGTASFWYRFIREMILGG